MGTRRGQVRRTSRRAYKSTPARRRARRRVSGIGKLDTNSLIGVVGGAVAGSFLGKVLPDTLDTKIQNGAKVGVGLAIPMFAKTGKMDTLLSGVGYGLVADGVLGLLKDFGVLSGLSGLGSTDTCSIHFTPDAQRLGATLDVPAGKMDIINGGLTNPNTDIDDSVFTEGTYDEVPVISGMDDDMSNEDLY